MPIAIRPDSVIRKSPVPTLAQMVREAQEFSKPKLKRLTREALLEWFNQSERLWIARTHYHLRGPRFIDFAERIGVDQSSAYQLVKLIPYKARILARCEDEGRYYGWETCLYWYERPPRRLWHHQDRDGAQEYGTPPAVFKRFGTRCTLDVCATKGKALCTDFILKALDGLTQEWHGVVWMNPPYGNLMPWCRKAYEYALAGGTVIALLPVWSDAPWFHDFVPFGKITLLRGKLSYIGRSGVAPFASMIVEWNPQTVKRRQDRPLDVVLDTGVCIGGVYKAA
jgi:hypothetical protein